MSSERLNRLTETFQRDVDAGEIPGAVVLVARNGKIAYEKAFGYQSREGNVPMKSDAIFRIASMSKPITSVAVMMLVEEGKIDLAAPVSQYLPEFNDLRVGTERAPVIRPMTVQDLLRHTSGLAYLFDVQDPLGRGRKEGREGWERGARANWAVGSGKPIKTPSLPISTNLLPTW